MDPATVLPDPLHDCTLGDILREHRRRWPRQVAVVDGDVRLTYPELDDRVNRLANGLTQLGVGRGQRLLWLGQNSSRLLEMLFAAAKLGAVCCPANWRQTADELAFTVTDTGPTVTFWQAEEVGDTVAAARVAAGAGAGGRWVRLDPPSGEPDEYETLLAADATDPDLAVADAWPVLQIYTAAFEGRPNGALLTHRALSTHAVVMALVADLDQSHRFLNSGPMFHLGTLMFTFATFVMGGTNVFLRRMDPEALCRLIDAEKVTGAFIMGASVDQILEVNADGRYDLSSLRGADPRLGGPPDRSRWGRRPGGYGQTEVNGMVTFTGIGAEGTSGLHGRSHPFAQVRILDEDGAEQPVGEVGEIAVRGPVVTAGYLRRDDENASRQAGGWHRTRDLGRREPDGSITFIGPKGRMLKSAAENIYPVEVERCLAEHPAVKEAAIIGVPDDRWVQSVKAIVVLEPDASASAEELIAFCRDRIASYKKPRSVVFVDVLPRTGWAVDYDTLDAEFGGGNYPGATTRSS